MEAAKASPDEPDGVRFTSQQQVVQLWTYQYALRLRHLSQVVGRNLRGHGTYPAPNPDCPLPSKSPRPLATHGYYYTIHTPKNKDEIYSSELQSTCNPNWVELQQENISPINLRSLKGIIIKLWFKPETEKEKAQLVTSWGIHFSGLIPIGPVLPYDHDNYEPNTLVLKLRHMFYTAPGSYHQSEPGKLLPLLRFGFSLPLSETKRCYTVSSLSRLHSTKRAQRQQEIRCQETNEVLEMRGVTRTSRASQLAAEVEDYRVKVALLREQLEAEIDQLRALKLSADNLDNQNQEKGLELLGGYQGLHRQLVHVRGLQDVTSGDWESLREACTCLGEWRRMLVSQLPLIYPITQDSDGKKYRICGVHLPDAENYDNCNEVALSVGLGFVAHLIVLMAHLLHVPLRYPVTPNGSLATITDTTSLQLRDSEREFPLYTRGKEREKLHFQYGVFLLNKNIAQIRWYCGIPTPDLRQTLPNLSALMMKITQSSIGGNQPMAVMPDVLVPPPASPVPVNLEVRTPATLLHQQRSPRLPLNPLARSTSQDNTKVPSSIADPQESSAEWKLGKSDSETDSTSETSPINASLYVREAVPLSGEGRTGKFVFVDKVNHTLVDSGHVDHHNIDERLSHSNGFSFSLDNGLNHIGGKHNPYYKISEISSCDDLKLMNSVSKALGLVHGSDPSLTAKKDRSSAEEAEDDGLPVFKEQTTELLRSWHEDAPSHYEGVSELGSSRKLEEVGVECDESFMCPASKNNPPFSRQDALICNSNKSIESVESLESKLIGGNGKQSQEKSQENPVHKESSDFSDKKNTTENEKDTKDSAVSVKEGLETESAALTLKELGVTEDMFLNDVAFRTAALASQNCSFKMSFSRQSTEDEYH
ncbi:UV radiation resistance-associated gene protein [Penaeus vannamei]|uniref:UV radiation resistance-associated gene protein n=1 Tax=Penaeus vannamei TaxID=6689 RepID=UPI00387F7EAD